MDPPSFLVLYTAVTRLHFLFMIERESASPPLSTLVARPPPRLLIIVDCRPLIDDDGRPENHPPPFRFMIDNPFSPLGHPPFTDQQPSPSYVNDMSPAISPSLVSNHDASTDLRFLLRTHRASYFRPARIAKYVVAALKISTAQTQQPVPPPTHKP